MIAYGPSRGLGDEFVVVTVAGQPTGLDGGVGGDGVRSLRSWLTGEDELQGRVDLLESPPSPGQMGAVVEALLVVLAPGGVAAVLAGAVLAWVRQRSADLRVTLRRSDGAEAEICVKRLRGLTAGELPTVVEALGGWFDADGESAVTGDQRSELDARSGGVLRVASGSSTPDGAMSSDQC
jgi:Effector Associated Constant Component 1